MLEERYKILQRLWQNGKSVTTTIWVYVNLHFSVTCLKRKLSFQNTKYVANALAKKQVVCL